MRPIIALINPAHCILPRPRSASPREESTVATVLDLTKAQRQAALIIFRDLAENAKEVRFGYAIERCPGYWVPDGTISKSLAKHVFPFVYDAVGAVQVSPPRAEDLGFPVRQTTRPRGKHWFVPAWGLDIARNVLAEVCSLLDIVLPDPHPRVRYVFSSTPEPVEVHGHGRSKFILCPVHDDHTPSAFVNPSGLVWCFACQKVVGRVEELSSGETVFYRTTGTEAIPTKTSSSTTATTSQTSQDTVEPLRLVEPGPVLSESETPVIHDYLEDGSYQWGPIKQDIEGDIERGVALPSPVHTPRPRGFNCDPLISYSNLPYCLGRVQQAGAPGRDTYFDDRKGSVGVWTDDFTIEARPVGYVYARSYPAQRGCQKHRGFERNLSAVTDLLDVMQNAEARCTQNAYDKAQYNAAMAEWHGDDWRSWVPDLYVGLDQFRYSSSVTFKPARCRREDLVIVKPQDFAPARTKWVGVDIDDVETMPSNEALHAAGVVVQDLLERHPEFSGRMAMVRTSRRGVQVVAELAVTRHDPEAFYRDEHVQRMLANLDYAVLRALREHGLRGGRPDPTIHAPGRYVRRPGPRVDKDGLVSMARLVFATLVFATK